MKLTPTALIVSLALAMLSLPLAAGGQPPARVPTIGMLNTLSPERPEGRTQLDVFRQALRELGYVEGRSIVIEHRWAEGRVERVPALAAELVRLKVDLIIAGATPHARAAKQATTTPRMWTRS